MSEMFPFFLLCELLEAYVTDLPVPLVLIVVDVNGERAAVVPETTTLRHARREASTTLGRRHSHLAGMMPTCTTLQLRLVSFHQQHEASAEAVEAAGDSDREGAVDVARYASLDDKSAKKTNVFREWNEMAMRFRKHVHVCCGQLHTCFVFRVN